MTPKPPLMSVEERYELLHAPITRGILATQRYQTPALATPISCINRITRLRLTRSSCSRRSR